MYESFYQLTKNPFRLNSDPDFFYTSAVHSRALDYLLYGAAQGEGFIVITGIPGLGKTMLLKTLCKELVDQKIIVGKLLTPQVASNDLMRLVAASFGLSHRGLTKAALLNVLENYFLSKVRKDKRILLIVDEAHHLSVQSIEELRLLMNLEDQGRQLFQCFLLGQEQLRKTLQLPVLEQAKQRVIAAYNLRPMDGAETRQYIEYRLRKAEWLGNPQFEDQAFEEIHKFSNGIPRRINLVCNRVLVYGYLEELDVIDANVIEIVVKELNEELSEGIVDDEPVSNTPQNNVINFDRPMETRIKRLESKVDMLKERLQKERRLLRKVMSNLEITSTNINGLNKSKQQSDD